VRAIALAALLLTACDDIPKTRTESEIRSIAEDVAEVCIIAGLAFWLLFLGPQCAP
jgi:hypothetical protein